MHLVFHYRPEGAEPQQWDFTPTKMSNGEAEEIEDITDLTFVEWQTKVFRGGIGATRALLFVLLKRDRPTLRFDQVSFLTGEIEIEVVDDADDEPEEPAPATETPASAEGNDD